MKWKADFAEVRGMATDVRTTMGYTAFWAMCEVDFGVPVGYDTARRFVREWAEIGKREITFKVTSGNEIPKTLPDWLAQRAINHKRGLPLDSNPRFKLYESAV